jgi:hypothetical protein
LYFPILAIEFLLLARLARRLAIAFLFSLPAFFAGLCVSPGVSAGKAKREKKEEKKKKKRRRKEEGSEHIISPLQPSSSPTPSIGGELDISTYSTAHPHPQTHPQTKTRPQKDLQLQSSSPSVSAAHDSA